MKAMVLIAALMASAAAQADPIDDVVRDQMVISHLPAVAVAIVDKGRTTKLAAYGTANLEWKQAASPDTRFQLASATKIFTAILLMRQVEQGLVRLDDPISTYFEGAPDSWKGIKVRQLANHSSGLPEDLGKPAPTSVAETVAAAMKAPLAYAPGSEARYGFTDFTILRAILEKQGKADLPTLIDREIVKRLGMTSTGFALAEDKDDVRTGDVLPQRASTYGWNGRHQRTSEFFFSPLGYGAGGLYSSIRDLAKLFAAIDDGRLLKPESIKEIVTPAALTNGRTGGFGIGWTVRNYKGVPVVGHSGGPALADILRIPSTGRTIIVLGNQHVFYPMLAERIADLSLAEPAFIPVADDRPAVARNVIGLFKAAAEGKDAKAFVGGSDDPSAILRDGFGKALVDAVGPLRDARLVRVESNGARIYRLRFQRKTMDWMFTADSDGRILSFQPA